MDCLECKICNNRYDEEHRRPRTAPCGHGLCSACLRSLIKNNVFQCPKCRKIRKVAAPDDLPLNFDLIDVIRAFKTKNVSLVKESGAGASGAENENVCNIHCKPIGHWCFKCKIWLCDICLESHSTLIGCSTDISSKAIEKLKMGEIALADVHLSQFKEDTKHVASKIEDHNKTRRVYLEMAENLEDEAKRLKILLESGTIHEKELIESKTNLLLAESPYAVTNRLNELAQQKQKLFTWNIKSLPQIQFQLNLPIVRNLPQNLVDLSKFGSFPKEISEPPILVFFELSQEEVVKGRVLVQLHPLSNIREYIVNILKGQSRTSLCGTGFEYSNNCMSTAGDIPLQERTVTLDNAGHTLSYGGYVRGVFSGEETKGRTAISLSKYHGYLCGLKFDLAGTNMVDVRTRVIGEVVLGLEFLQECYRKFIQVSYRGEEAGMKISDCGILRDDGYETFIKYFKLFYVIR